MVTDQHIFRANGEGWTTAELAFGLCARARRACGLGPSAVMLARLVLGKSLMGRTACPRAGVSAIDELVYGSPGNSSKEPILKVKRREQTS